MRLIQTLSSCLCTGIIALFTACSQAPQSPIDSVDPFIGTGFHGHTYPGATAPYGAVQLSPDTRKGNWDACSGYHYSDSTLMGFSHTHLSGTGCIDLGDILFRPSLQTPLAFSHSDEKASPGYYSVNLKEAGVLAELTTTPHDVYGLTQLFGGREAFIADLDSLFMVTSEVVGDLVDVTGLVGQYAHGNEPSHHMAYLYSYVGQPWKTQEWTRRLLDEMYQPTPEGIIGNEDCGQMSAWYILSSLGFYSVCPGSNQFILTTPLFDKANMKLGNGKTLVITANQPDKNKYITKVTLNGEEISHCYITYDQLMQGGTLDFTLSATPDKRWGTAPEYAPYSYTEQPTVSIPYIANDLDLFEGEITAELKSTTPEAVIHYTLDGSEPDENAPVYSEPFVLKETTIIKAKGYKKGFVPSRTYSIQATKAVLRPALSIQPTKHGVAYTYYEGEFQWVADLQKAKVVETGTIPEPSILNAKLPDHFGYIFTGYIYAPEDGVYEFSTRSDDGSVLYIGKEKVVDNDASHAAIDATGRIPLQKGYHPFALHYFEDYEGEYLGWSWRTPSMSTLDTIPTENLYIN